jgi:methyl-galactoside transport system substrate-binding protein
MKRKFMLGCIIALVGILSACQTPDNSVIPMMIYDQDDLFMQTFEASLLEASQAYGYTFDVYDANGSQLIQNNQFKDIVAENPPLILINPVDRVGVYPLIELAEQAGIPLVFFNREPLREDILASPDIYYVGSEASQSARIQYELIEMLLEELALDLNQDESIQTLILKGQPGHQDAEIRTDVIQTLLTGSEHSFDLLDVEVAYFDRQEATGRLLQRFTDETFHVELIVSNNDAMALGAIDALVQSGLMVNPETGDVLDRGADNWVPVVGIDGLDVAIDSIDSGLLYGTVFHNTDLMSEVITELIEALLTDADLSGLSHPLMDGRVIYIDYEAYLDD